LSVNKGLDADVLLKIIKFQVTIIVVSVCFSWTLDQAATFLSLLNRMWK